MERVAYLFLSTGNSINSVKSPYINKNFSPEDEKKSPGRGSKRSELDKTKLR